MTSAPSGTPLGYLIAEIDVHDANAYAAYPPKASASVDAFGGRYIVRGGRSETLEGAQPTRVVVIEFPSLEAAKAWYESEEYQAAIPFRTACSSGRLFIIEGSPSD